jgi:uncharacterized protein YuzB (UPF0349 family)
MHHGTDQVMKQLESNAEYDVIEYGCLGNCGECGSYPYALVNGHTMAAESPEELMQRIQTKLAEMDGAHDY